jgi:hypothetical protein
MSLKTEDYTNLVELIAVVAEAEQRLGEMQSGIDLELRVAVDEHKADYIALQLKKAEAEASIETLARKHPEWFEKAKTVKTIYGSVKLTETSALEVPNAAVSVRLIEACGEADVYLRVAKELDKEMLEGLTDDELARFGIIRKRGESCKITPAKVNLGQAIKSAEKAGKGAK